MYNTLTDVASLQYTDQTDEPVEFSKKAFRLTGTAKIH